MVDAVVCLSGDGLARVIPSVQLAKMYGAMLVLAGSRDAPPDAYHWVDVLPHTTDLPATRIVCVDAENTWEQAVNVIAEARRREWVSLVLVASGWHVYRAFLTFVKALEGQHDIVFHPFRVNSQRMDAWEFLVEESLKVEAYRLKGHCATDDELQAYMTWRDAA